MRGSFFVARLTCVKRKTFTYRKDAEAWARETEAAMERGLWLDRTEAENTTLAELLERHEQEVTPRQADLFQTG